MNKPSKTNHSLFWKADLTPECSCFRALEGQGWKLNDRALQLPKPGLTVPTLPRPTAPHSVFPLHQESCVLIHSEPLGVWFPRPERLPALVSLCLYLLSCLCLPSAGRAPRCTIPVTSTKRGSPDADQTRETGRGCPTGCRDSGITSRTDAHPTYPCIPAHSLAMRGAQAFPAVRRRQSFC